MAYGRDLRDTIIKTASFLCLIGSCLLFGVTFHVNYLRVSLLGHLGRQLETSLNFPLLQCKREIVDLLYMTVVKIK